MNCEEGGNVQDNKCTVCKKGYTQNKVTLGQCYRDCNGEYWELPSENDNYTCIASCDDSSDNKILVEETNQCVKDCRNDPLCFYCQGKSLFNYKNKCVSECLSTPSYQDSRSINRFTNEEIPCVFSAGKFKACSDCNAIVV